MNSLKIACISIVTIAVNVSFNIPVQAGESENYIGPTGSFGLETTGGINSKFVIADHFSLRPFLEFGKNDDFLRWRRAFGASVTYDFNNSKDVIQPFVGAGYEFNNTESRILEPTTRGLFSTPTLSPKNSNNLFLEAGADLNVSPRFSVNSRVRIPLGDTGRDPTFSVGAGFRF